jgi:hypothetical protein
VNGKPKTDVLASPGMTNQPGSAAMLNQKIELVKIFLSGAFNIRLLKKPLKEPGTDG